MCPLSVILQELLRGGANIIITHALLCVFTDCPADIIFLLDDSTSIGDEDWDNTLTFINMIIDAFPIASNQTRVGALTFSSRAEVEFHLSKYQDKATLQSAFAGITLSGGDTNIYSAINVMRTQMLLEEHGERTEATDVAILITDGQSNKDASKTEAEALAAREVGVEFIAIGITDKADKGDLLKVTGEVPGEDSRVLLVPGFDELVTLVGAVVQHACHYTPTTPPTTTVTTPPTTTVATTPPPTSTTVKETSKPTVAEDSVCE